MMMIVIQLKLMWAHLQLIVELVAFDSDIFSSINDEHSLPVWFRHSTVWKKKETNKKVHETGQCQPFKYPVHDDIIKMKWTN